MNSHIHGYMPTYIAVRYLKLNYITCDLHYVAWHGVT